MATRSGLRWFDAPNPRAAYNTGIWTWIDAASQNAIVIAAPTGCPSNSSLSKWIKSTSAAPPKIILGALPLRASQKVRIGFFDSVRADNCINLFGGNAIAGGAQAANIAIGTQWTTVTLNLVYAPGSSFVVSMSSPTTTYALRMEFL